MIVTIRTHWLITHYFSWNPAGAIRAGRNPATYKWGGETVHIDGKLLSNNSNMLPQYACMNPLWRSNKIHVISIFDLRGFLPIFEKDYFMLMHHTCFLTRERSLWFCYKTKATGPSCFCFGMSPKSQFITFKGFVWNNWSIDHFPWNPPLWRHVVYMFLLFLRQTFWHWLILFSIICLNYINHNLIKWFHSLNHVKIKQYSIYLILWRV